MIKVSSNLLKENGINMNYFLPKTMKVYVYLGYWPLPGSSNLSENLRYSVGLFFVITIAVLNALQYIDLFMQWGNWDHISENITITLVFTTCLFKIQVIYCRREDIISLSDEIDLYVNEIFIEKNKEKINRLESCQQRATIIGNFYWTFIFFTITVMLVWPVFVIYFNGDHSLRPLIAPAYFPFSLNATGNYIAAYLSEIIIGSLVATHMVAFDTLFVTYILFAIARLQILQYSIETVNIVGQKKLYQNISGNFSWLELSKKKLQKIWNRELKKCIQEHRRIITFCKIIDSMLSLIFFLMFFVYAVVICFIGFYATLLGTSFSLLKLGQYLLGLLVETFLYYWHGNELMMESLKVTDSTFTSDWYDFGERNVKTIIFIILRSQKPIFLTVGKFYTVTLQTLLTLLKSSYSYFALLNRYQE